MSGDIILYIIAVPGWVRTTSTAMVRHQQSSVVLCSGGHRRPASHERCTLSSHHQQTKGQDTVAIHETPQRALPRQLRLFIMRYPDCFAKLMIAHHLDEFCPSKYFYGTYCNFEKIYLLFVYI